MRQKSIKSAKGISRTNVGLKLREEIKRAREAAERNYLNYPNVVGVAAGTEFKKKKPTNNHYCIQFYVKRKTHSRKQTGRPLPRFVYGRFKDGRLNSRVKFPTDVIKVGRISMACGGGSQVDAFDERGTITLLFRNKTTTDGHNFYLITCAHVVGNLEESPPMHPELESDCRPDAKPFAETLLNSRAYNQTVIYDIALARVQKDILPKPPDLAVIDEQSPLKNFFPRDKVRPSLQVSCQLPVSRIRDGIVRSEGGTVLAILDGRRYKVQNAYSLDAPVEPGDSGGLLYVEEQAVGIVFARSPEGWAWFQPLKTAFDFLKQLSSEEGIKIKAF